MSDDRLRRLERRYLATGEGLEALQAERTRAGLCGECGGGLWHCAHTLVTKGNKTTRAIAFADSPRHGRCKVIETCLEAEGPGAGKWVMANAPRKYDEHRFTHDVATARATGVFVVYAPIGNLIGKAVT